MGKEDRRESFLINLGRATRRGVRQCRKCGTLNGTRGYSCKNKSCDVVFKEAGEKRKLSTEACKIETGTDLQIYSVRVRDKGPDYRGFVQLNCPNNNNNSGNNQTFVNPFDAASTDPLSTSSFSNTSTNTIISEIDESTGVTLRYTTSSSSSNFNSSGGNSGLEAAAAGGNLDASTISDLGDTTSLLLESANSQLISNGRDRTNGIAAASTTVTAQPTAHCYVDSCHKLMRNSGTKGTCSHIKAASQCFKNSESVMLKSSVFNSMPLHTTLKNEIWQLATGSQGPLVQRVSKNILVVKCHNDAMHPLGFLHFSFQSSRSCRDSNDCGKYFCSCRSFKSSGNLLKDVISLRGGRDLVPLRSCVHLYACLLALASHAHLAQEFAQYIALMTGEDSKPRVGTSAATRGSSNGGGSSSGTIVSAMEDDSGGGGGGTVKIQVTEDDDDDDDTTAYIRVSEAGDEELGRERSFLILNDGSDLSCQVEVEVLQDDCTENFLQALDSSSHSHHHSSSAGGDGGVVEDIDGRHQHAIGQGINSNHQHNDGGRVRESSLITQGDLESKLEIQLHTNEDGDVELCTSDGGSISVHPCVTASVHQQHLTTINNTQHLATMNSNQAHLTSNGQPHLASISSNQAAHLHHQHLATSIDPGAIPNNNQQHLATITTDNNQQHFTTSVDCGGDQQHFTASVSDGQQHLNNVNSNNDQHMEANTGNNNINNGNNNNRNQHHRQHISTITTDQQQQNLTTITNSICSSNSILNTGLNNNNNNSSVQSHSSTITNSTHCHIINTISSNSTNTSLIGRVTTKHEDPAVAQASSALLTLHNTTEKKRHHFSRVVRKAREPVVEENCSLAFVEWLSGATERVNRTMQYTHPGRPAPLVFHIPTVFMDCLLERIQHHSRKKIQAIQTSVPNVDPSVAEKQTRYAWHLYNLAHTKTVFHTPYVTLQTTRSFIVHRNGTYQSYQAPVDLMTSLANSSTRGSSSQPHIRPQEYRTIMKVGPSAYHPASKPTPFVIEWIPEVFPLSKMGELRIKFEFEHIHNGQLVKNIAFKEVISTATHNISLGNSVSAAAAILQNPIIFNTTSSGSNNNTGSIITTTNSGNKNSAAQSSSGTSKTLHSTKQSPPAIAPKFTVLSQIKESSIEDVNGSTILDITMPHETFVDAEGYTTLLFSADTNPILN